jgi:hypothetical protein
VCPDCGSPRRLDIGGFYVCDACRARAHIILMDLIDARAKGFHLAFSSNCPACPTTQMPAVDLEDFELVASPIRPTPRTCALCGTISDAPVYTRDGSPSPICRPCARRRSDHR